MKNLCVLVLSGVTVSFSDAASVQADWLCMPDNGGDDEHAVEVIETDDGYVLVGSTSIYSIGTDILMTKTDASGNKLWSRVLDYADADNANSVQQTQDGGYIILAYSRAFNEPENAHSLLIRTDALGNELWVRGLGLEYSFGGESIRRIRDSGFIIIGTAVSERGGGYSVGLIKTDSNGDEMWTRIFGGDLEDRAHSVQETQDGGYIIAGSTYSLAESIAEGPDVYLIRTDSEGNELWTRTFRHRESDHANSVALTDDGGYIIVGGTFSLEEGSNIYLIKTDPEGNEVWSRVLGEDFDSGTSVLQTPDGGYAVLGFFDIFKTDAEGSVVWSFPLSDVGLGEGISAWFIGRSFIQTSDCGYAIAGSFDTDSDDRFDVFLSKLSFDSVPFIRGDPNMDGGVDISDAVCILYSLFGAGMRPPITDAADANDDGAIDIADAVYILTYLFRNGPRPPEPFPALGTDPTPDNLACQ